MSNFASDLNTEHILTEYLDDLYVELGFDVKRISNQEYQNKGIDVIIKHNGNSYFIDEKAQLHYLNKKLPTFAFELSYLKGKILKKGWLLDEKKETNYYFLITNIKLNNYKKVLESKDDIKSLQITSVNRLKLIKLLGRKGLDSENLEYLTYSIREDKAYGKHIINCMDNKDEGNIHFTEALSEQPINLVLKLDYLTREGAAKAIYPQK